jgi:uncharacterized membrane protein YuzA (DUF378 family)
MKALHMVTFILLAIGGLNWGLTALGYNVVNMILGSMPAVENAVYILVGLSAVAELAMHPKNCKMCGSQTTGAPQM